MWPISNTSLNSGLRLGFTRKIATIRERHERVQIVIHRTAHPSATTQLYGIFFPQVVGKVGAWKQIGIAPGIYLVGFRKGSFHIGYLGFYAYLVRQLIHFIAYYAIDRMDIFVVDEIIFEVRQSYPCALFVSFIHHKIIDHIPKTSPESGF